MPRLFVTILAILALAVPAFAKDDKKTTESDLVTWANGQASRLPDEIDGIKIYRVNGFDTDGKARVTAFIDMPGLNQEKCFEAAIISVIDNMDTGLDAIEAIDFNSKKFAVMRSIEQGEGKNTTTFTFTTAFSFDEGLMSFVTYDITIGFREKGLIPRKMAIEKMNPAANKRHKELTEDFALVSSRMIDDIVRNSAKNSALPIIHWNEIKAGTVIKGMNETEVKLIGGQPRSVTKSGNRVQWMFNNDFIVIFNDGFVSNVMQ